MARRIVIFGDSWAYGSDLVDPELVPKLESEGYKLEDAEWKYFHENLPYREQHRYSNLLQKALDIPVLNLSEPGDSLIGMKEKFINWFSEQSIHGWDTTVIFGTTGPERYSFYSKQDKKWISSGHLQYGMKDHLLAENWKRHVAYSSCRELSDYTLKEFVLSTRALCLEKNMTSIFAPVFNESKTDTIFSMPFSMKELMEIEKRNGHNVWAWGGHPNELGHKFIAKHLIKFMKERKLIQ